MRILEANSCLLSAANPSADKREVAKDSRTVNQSWLWGEILLAGLLGASLALFLAYPSLRTHYDLPELRLVLQTTMALAGLLVAVLAATRYSVEGRRVDLLLASGFFVTSLSAAVFAIGPRFSGRDLLRAEAWSALIGAILGQALIAIAPFSRGRSKYREWSIANAVAAAGITLFVAWSLLRALGAALPSLSPPTGQPQPFYLTGTLALQAFVSLVAVVGWGARFARRGDDLARWLALGFTLMLFAALHLVFQPLLASTYVSQSDFLRMLAYIVILVGAWRAIQFAEFGRAVAEERARVAREIHDGLAQYLFAVSTHASMLENGAPIAESDAAAEGGRAPRAAGSALRDPRALLGERNRAVRRGASRATSTCSPPTASSRSTSRSTARSASRPTSRSRSSGSCRKGSRTSASTRTRRARRSRSASGPFGERFVNISDDGDGFDGAEDDAAGQGLKNMRARAESIEGGFTLRSTPGRGTALEVVLRT